jgi:hypothetical protein
MSLTRRAALQVIGAATIPAVVRAQTPSEADALEYSRRIATSTAQGTLFRADERATVSAIADAILPRTNTPGALDVAVPAFVELIATEWMNDAERTAFREGLAALDAHATATEGRAWPALDQAAREREAAWAEGSEERALPAKAAFRRLKGLTVQGFFSSERVQKEVLRTQIIPGRYLGCAPLPAVPASGTEDPPNEARFEHEGHHDA